MSRIGKNPITIPANTHISIAEGVLTIKGPLGAIARPVHSMVSVIVEGETVTVAPLNSSKLARSLWGTFASHIKNMIAGVNKKYEKKLTLEGIGYRVEVQGRNMKFLVGFSHPVILAIPDGIDVVVEKNQITVSGIDKDAVGQFSAVIRAVKKPEPYKGKGIRYDGEYVRRKQGKKASA